MITSMDSTDKRTCELILQLPTHLIFLYHDRILIWYRSYNLARRLFRLYQDSIRITLSNRNQSVCGITLASGFSSKSSYHKLHEHYSRTLTQYYLYKFLLHGLSRDLRKPILSLHGELCFKGVAQSLFGFTLINGWIIFYLNKQCFQGEACHKVL